MRRIVLCLGLALMASPFLAKRTAANSVCSAGNYSTVANATCDIGSLEFTFFSITGSKFSYDNLTNSYLSYTTWGNSDFYFTPVTNGFELTLLAGPQMVTSTANTFSDDSAVFAYSVSTTNGWISNVNISGGAISATGNSGSSTAFYSVGGTWTAFDVASYNFGQPPFVTYQGPLATYKSGGEGTNTSPFSLEAGYGASASWDGAPTVFTNTLSSTFIPEPSVFELLGFGLVALKAISVLVRPN